MRWESLDLDLSEYLLLSPLLSPLLSSQLRSRLRSRRRSSRGRPSPLRSLDRPDRLRRLELLGLRLRLLAGPRETFLSGLTETLASTEAARVSRADSVALCSVALATITGVPPRGVSNFKHSSGENKESSPNGWSHVSL